LEVTVAAVTAAGQAAAAMEEAVWAVQEVRAARTVAAEAELELVGTVGAGLAVAVIMAAVRTAR